MGLDTFATYLGTYIFGEITAQYGRLMKSKSKIDFKKLTGSTFRGIPTFCFPFILKDQEGKTKFINIFKKAIDFLPKVKPRVR
jgi:hypothetical protein